MKHRLVLTILLAFSLSVMAAPLKNVEVRLTQPNGQVVNCFASGDEFYNYLHDANGFTIVQGEGGYYVYATKDAEGNVVPTNFIVGETDPASKGLQPYVKISKQEYYARRHEREQYIQRPQVRNGRELNHGLYNNLVVFIRFAGDTYHSSSFSTVEAMFNGDDYEANSMHNYYHHTSYNQLDLWSHFFPQPDGEVILSYEDIHPKAYYQPYDPVTNPIGYHDYEAAEREFSMLERAINYIEDMVPYDLDLDYNDDGKVDNVVFVIKGEPGEWASLLWPHRWCIYDRYVPLHNLQVYDFNLQLEQGGYFNVSTLCHEMFHSLGAPDLYHYSGGIDPVGSWDLMCGTSEPPQQTSTYMKYKYGNWVDEIPVIYPENANTEGSYELEAVSWEGGRRNGYMISLGDPNQFFFVEYRDKQNIFEQEIPGSGMLIYRIDTRYTGNAGWNGYDNLDEVYLFRPGGTPDEAGNLDQAFFSEESGRISFNYNTDPYPFINNQPYQFYDPGFEITNISRTGDRMSFDLLPYGGEYSGPLITNFNAHVNSLDHQVELSWDAWPYADYYKVFCDGSGISGGITDTTFVHPYTDADNGYHTYSVMYVTGGMMHVYHAETYAWVILGNYETLHLSLSCDSPDGTKGGEVEVSFSDPAMKTQYLTVYRGSENETDLYVPANTEVTFRWLPGFDPEGQGVHVEAMHYNTNGQGTVFAIDNPTQGVLAIYTIADDGLGYMHPQNFTASSNGTDVLLKWTLPVAVNGVKIFRDGICLQDNSTGSEFLDNTVLRSGTHAYQVESICGSATSWNPDDIVYATTMNYYCEPPLLEGQHSENCNELHWEAPQVVGPGLLAYENQAYVTQIGSSSYKWGIKIEPEHLSVFEGHPLTHLELFDGIAGNYTFTIYNGETPVDDNLIYTQQHAMNGSHQMIKFALDEQVPFDTNLPLWITVASSGASKPIPCGNYVGEPNSCLVKSGSHWKPVTSFNLYYSWILHAYTTPLEAPNDFTYNLYWGPEEGHDNEMVLGMENLTATNATHNSNENMRYNVTAVWNGRETEFSNCIYLGPSVEAEDVQVNGSVTVFPNPANSLINIQGNGIQMVTLFTITGQKIYDNETTGDMTTISMEQLPKGIYLLNVLSEDGLEVVRVIKY